AFVQGRRWGNGGRRDEVEKSIDFDPFPFKILRNIHIVCFPEDSSTRAESNKRGEGSQTGREHGSFLCSRTPHAGLIRTYVMGGARCMRIVEDHRDPYPE